MPGNSKRHFITQLRHCFVPGEQTKSISPLQTLFPTLPWAADAVHKQAQHQSREVSQHQSSGCGEGTGRPTTPTWSTPCYEPCCQGPTKIFEQLLPSCPQG